MKCSRIDVYTKDGGLHSFEEAKPNMASSALQVEELHLMYRDGMAQVNYQNPGSSTRFNVDFHVGAIKRIERTD